MGALALVGEGTRFQAGRAEVAAPASAHVPSGKNLEVQRSVSGIGGGRAFSVLGMRVNNQRALAAASNQSPLALPGPAHHANSGMYLPPAAPYKPVFVRMCNPLDCASRASRSGSRP